MLVKTRITVAKNNNRFRITVRFEHGDGDQTTYDTTQFKGMTDQELLEWVAKFKQYKVAIDELRWYGKKGFSRDQMEEDLKIEVPSDCIYSGDYDYVPATAIDKIEWVDDEGIVYAITGY